MTPRRSQICYAVAIAVLAPAAAEAAAPPQGEAQALDLAKQSMALRSVRGPGNQTPQVAAHYKSVLVNGGFPAADVAITPVDDTAYLVARWAGSDPSLKAILISGHMDVVEAKRADWQRDPFTPVVENGYLYGRGATDMKLDGAVAIASLIALRRGGFKPRREILLVFSGDEETTMKTSQILADRFAKVELVINIDGGNGRNNDQTGQPMFLAWGSAEKTYADFELTVTNEGGHSSRPRTDNAIDQLAAALVRIGRYRFKPELNDITRAYFVEGARFQDARTAAAMRRFAANPADQQAIAVLRADPEMVGKIGTTCVATMISGGHALNALPQRATANINCRIFPGRNPAAIMAELKRVAAEPAVAFRDVTEGAVTTDASPMLPRFTAAIAKAMARARPGVAVFPTVDQGGSDNMWFRAKGVPSYTASGIFLKGTEDFSHGLDERTPIASIGPAIDYTMALLTELAK